MSELAKLQQVAGLLALVTSLICLVLVCVWADHKIDDPKDRWLGGLDGYVDGYAQWSSWHAVLMVTGMCFSFTHALLSYRILPFSHEVNKIIHFIWHCTTVFCIGFGLHAIVKFHDLNQLSDLASLHSWLGICTLILFTQNYIFGVISFLLPNVSVEWKRKYFPSHKFLGMMTMLAAIITMETGIHQETGSYGCFYQYQQNSNKQPGLHYLDIPPGCRVSSGLGLLILLNGILVAFALWEFPVQNHKTGGFY